MADDAQHYRGLAWGLNLDEPDVTTPEEIAEFRRISGGQLGSQQDGLDYWLDTRPDVLKRYRAWSDQLRVRVADEAQRWGPGSMGVLFCYSIYEFPPGIRYNIPNFSCRAFTKAQMLEMLGLMFRYTGPRGMSAIARAIDVSSWPEPEHPLKWPAGWAPDPDAFKSGADFSTLEPSAEDTRKILDWHERWAGEVPRHVGLLARHRPDLLKASRQRYENALRVLPKQADAHALIQLNIQRGFKHGIREGVLLGRGFGMTRGQVLEAVSWGTFYGGAESLGTFHDAAGDILDGWSDPKS